MAKLSRKAAADVAEMGREDAVHVPFEPIPRYEILVSTGSTLLDCAITGKRIHGGGIPGGIMVEIYGPSGKGKTAIAVEIGASAQAMGGTVRFNDPEGRLDMEYASMYGLEIDKKNYTASDTVEDVFEDLLAWFNKDLPKDKMHVYICDSIAALSTNVEMAEGDKMGMGRAKALSQMTRRIARLVSNKHRLVVFTNQIRQKPNTTGFGGPTEVTPGGEAVKFYASLRLRVGNTPTLNKIPQTKKVRGVEVERIIGINSLVHVSKNSCGSPYREAVITIIFDYGLDDVRANLEFCKQFEPLEEAPDEDSNNGKGKKQRAYVIGDYKTTRLPSAIKYVEDNNLQDVLRENAIALWKEIETHFAMERKPKARFHDHE